MLFAAHAVASLSGRMTLAVPSHSDEHVIRFAVRRAEWWRTEWPAVMVWVLPAAIALLVVLTLTAGSTAWWAALLLVWWPLLGRKAFAIGWFLLRGDTRRALHVRADGHLFVAENGGEPRYSHWVGFQDEGQTFVLQGGDGRYRLVLPKRALTAVDYRALRERAGVDLTALGPGQTVKLPRGT